MFVGFRFIIHVNVGILIKSNLWTAHDVFKFSRSTERLEVFRRPVYYHSFMKHPVGEPEGCLDIHIYIGWKDY